MHWACDTDTALSTVILNLMHSRRAESVDSGGFLAQL